MGKKIIYSLNVQDVQTVALDEIDRELSKKEVKQIEDLIAERIDWYGAIAYAIAELQCNANEAPVD
jgi:hypothetical protein